MCLLPWEEASLVTDGTIRRVTVVYWGQTAQWEPVSTDYMNSRSCSFSRGLRDLHSLAMVRPRRTLQLPAENALGKYTEDLGFLSFHVSNPTVSLGFAHCGVVWGAKVGGPRRWEAGG